MSAYLEREMRYNESIRKGYRQIVEIAKRSSIPHKGNNKQYVDFIVGKEGVDRVVNVRVLVDFRGEYFSSFILGSDLPVSVTSPIRNRINLTAQEAFDYIIQKAKELNS